MDTKSRLAEDPGGGQNSDEMSPQERLQRLADAFDAGQDWPDGHILELVAAAQDRPARAEVAPSAETGGKDSDWWRNVALFLAIVVVVTGVAGVMLRVLAPTHVGPDNSPGPATTGRLQPASQAAPMTTPAQPQPPQAATEPTYPRRRRPIARRPISFRGRRPRTTRFQPLPPPHPRCQNRAWMARRNRARPRRHRPNSTRPDPVRPPASQRSANAVADPSPAAGAATVSDTDSAHPPCRSTIKPDRRSRKTTHGAWRRSLARSGWRRT